MTWQTCSLEQGSVAAGRPPRTGDFRNCRCPTQPDPEPRKKENSSGPNHSSETQSLRVKKRAGDPRTRARVSVRVRGGEWFGLTGG